MSIHSSTIVAAGAEIAPTAEIGPFCLIGPQVQIGDGTKIESHVVLEGRVIIAQGNTIGHGAIIGAPPQDYSFSGERKSGVRIGNNNIIREYCTIHRGTAEGSETVVGANNFIMAGAHLGHNCEIGNHVIIANNCLLGGYARVDDQAFLGGGCVFHQYLRVGRLAITQGGSAFSMDVPPFVMAAKLNQVFGLNSIGLRRAGFGPEERKEIKAAFKLIYLSGINVSQALKEAQRMNFGPRAQEFFSFIAAGKKRGVCPYRGKSLGDSET